MKLLDIVALVALALAALYFVMPGDWQSALSEWYSAAHNNKSGGTGSNGNSEFIVERLASNPDRKKLDSIDEVLKVAKIARPRPIASDQLHEVRLWLERTLTELDSNRRKGEEDLSRKDIDRIQAEKAAQSPGQPVVGDYGTRTLGMKMCRAELRALSRGDYLAFTDGEGMAHWQALTQLQRRAPYRFVYVDSFAFKGGKAAEIVIYVPKKEV